MRITFSIFAFLTLLCTTVNAQRDYSDAVGLRFGNPLSISYKKFINDQGAVEGIVGFNSGTGYTWVNVSVAYQIHNEFNSTDAFVSRLRWYYGAGISAFFWSWRDSHLFLGESYSRTTFGIQGYLGLDYTFENIPLNLSVDWVPTIFISGLSSGFGAGYGALAARYTF